MINFHHRFQDMTEYELRGELSQFLWADHPHQFLALLNYLYRRGGNAVPFERVLGKALATACRTGAVKCVAALINGNSPLVVDIHSPCYKSLYPLHWAADSGHPGVTELLLYHGARTDVRCNCSSITDDYLLKEARKSHPCILPLHLAIYNIRSYSSLPDLLIQLSLPIMRNLLETVGLLASKTEETKEEFLHFARNGQVAECAILLVVARKKLLDSVAAVGELVGYLTQRNELSDKRKRVMIDLIYLFHKAGDEIEAYVKKDKLEEKLQGIPEVKFLLQQAGFRAASFEYTYLSRLSNIQRLRFYETYLYTQKVADIGMPHYSTSGCRWVLSKNPEPGCYKFQVPADKKLRNSRMPFWFPSSNYSKVSANLYQGGLESGSDAKLKRFGFNSSNILSSKPWALLAGVVKRIAGRRLHVVPSTRLC